MKQFLKFTFASCLGVFLAMFFLFFMGMMIVIGAAGASKTTTIDSKSVLKLDLDYTVPEHTNNMAAMDFNFNPQDVLGLKDILDMIHTAREDDRIEGIYVYPIHTVLGTTQTAQVCEALRKFKESGKWVLSYAEYYPQGSYAIAAQADTVMLNPIGSVDFRGYAAVVPFFKELLDKIGVKMQIYYAGNFKSATEPFRRNDMSPENKLQTHAYLDDAYDAYLGLVSEGRGLSKDQLWDVVNNLRSQNAEDALSSGLIDEIAYQDQAYAWMKRHMGLEEDADIKFVSINEYYAGRTHSSSTAKDRIAIVYAEGEIVPGETDYGTIGDQRYVELLTEIRKNEKIKAVVLRVNSPGGSILASENILRELSLIQAAGKPLVVSMGDYAASGGYYISAPADSIFAEPTTLTGSIGVFSMMPNPRELLNDKLGVYFDSVRTGTYSASFSPFFEWSEREHAEMQARTDAFYELFLNHVARFRDMTRDEVHEIAQGRIWSGTDAVANGLVDRIGDLEHAVKSAALLANVEEYRTTEYPRVPNQITKLVSQITGEEVSIAERYVENRINRQIPHFSDLKRFIESDEPMMRLPVILSY